MRKLTTEGFIEKAKKVHGDKYDYSKVNYVDYSTRVCITCKKHGDFWVTPSNHLYGGGGCKQCKNEVLVAEKSLSTEEFIEKARKVHGDKYDYSKVNYVNMKTPLKIICHEHGEFLQRGEDHIYNKSGCPLCCNKKQYTTDTFIEEAKKVHGDKYDYSKTEYVNAKTKVCIICPKHGEFWQRPEKHLIGQGCVECSYEERGVKKRMTFENFLSKAITVHSDEFTYDEKSFVDFNSKLNITCNKCGKTFSQKASNHISLRQGCPYCNLSKLENEVKTFLEENEIKYEQQKRFEWLGRKSLDFFLLEYNVAIECQGIQHYKPIDFFGGEKHFEYVKKNDDDKLLLCNTHGIEVMYYTNIGEFAKCLSHFTKLEDMLSYIKLLKK